MDQLDLLLQTEMPTWALCIYVFCLAAVPAIWYVREQSK